jgi:hypothetical protein
MPTHGSVINLIDGFLKEASNLDLAGDAKTTHPSANVDDKTKPATEGARSSENEADVKKEVPDTINDTASENKGGTEGATPNGDQGTETMASDSGLKGTVDTPKKDHSKAMSDSGPGDDTFSGNWDKASAAGSLVADANALLADVAMLGGVEVPNTAAPAAPATSKEAGDDTVGLFKEAASQYPEDVEAGYVAAALLAQRLGLMKEASEDVSTEAVAAIQKEASSDAENYVDYLTGFAEEMEKAAQPMMGGADPSALAALAGAGDAGGEMGAEEMGEGAAEMGAGAEEMGAGAEELGDADEDEEAAAEEAIQALLAAEEGEPGGGEEAGEEDLAEVLQDAGVDIPSLMAALQEGGGEEEEEGAPEVV